MKRRDLIALLAGTAAAWPLAALAREPGKIYRIGWLAPTTGLPAEFRDALREFGWIEGTTVVFEVRQAEGRLERLPDLATDLVRSNVDIIVAQAPTAIRAAKQATTTIPIVMAFWGGPDLVQSGIIASYARPGGNITGVQMLLYALNAKRLDLLHQAVPSARKIAVLVPRPRAGQRGAVAPCSACRSRERARVEQPTKFELGINLKTAKELGLTIPPILLAYADEVIE